jgi:PleD family two-component response regulator
MLTPANRSRQQQGQQRILYVGNDQETLAALRAVLRRPEFHIVSCPDRDSAIRFIKSDIRYDIFLFDLEMRDSAAFELAELAQSLDHRRHTPIVLAASEIDSSLEELARNAGAIECVSKNSGMSALPNVITSLLATGRNVDR